MITKRDFHFSCERRQGKGSSPNNKIHSKWLTFSLKSKVVIYVGRGEEEGRTKLSGKDELTIVSGFFSVVVVVLFPAPPLVINYPLSYYDNQLSTKKCFLLKFSFASENMILLFFRGLKSCFCVYKNLYICFECFVFERLNFSRFAFCIQNHIFLCIGALLVNIDFRIEHKFLKGKQTKNSSRVLLKETFREPTAREHSINILRGHCCCYYLKAIKKFLFFPFEQKEARKKNFSNGFSVNTE